MVRCHKNKINKKIYDLDASNKLDLNKLQILTRSKSIKIDQNWSDRPIFVPNWVNFDSKLTEKSNLNLI